jgi:WD40 repeat protein
MLPVCCAVLLALGLAAVPGCRRAVEEERLQIVPQIDPVQARRVVYAPTAPLLLVVEASGLVGLWDAADPSAPQRLAWIPAGAVDACLTADAQGIVTAGWDGKLRRWTANGRLLWATKEGHGGAARAVAAGNDRIVSGGDDGKMRFWSLDGAAIGKPVDAHDGYVVSVALAPGGEVASAGIDDAIHLWRGDAAAGLQRQTLHQGSRERAKHLQQQLKLDVNMGWDHAVAFSPSGDALVAAAFDGGVRLWRAPGWGEAATLQPPGLHHSRAVAYSPKGDLIAAAGFNGRVTFWGADGSKRGEVGYAFLPVISVAFTPAGDRVVVTASDDRLRLFAVDDARETAFPTAARGAVGGFAWARDEPLFAFANVRSGQIDLWSPGRSDRVERFAGAPGVRALAFGMDDAGLIGTGKDRTVQVWRRDGSSLAIDTDFGSWIDGVTPSPDGKTVAASGSPGTVQLLGLDGSKRFGYRPCGEVIYGMQFSADGTQIALLCDDGTVKWWGLNGSAGRAILAADAGAARGLALAPDGGVLSGALDGTLRLWSGSGKPVATHLVGLPIDQVGFFAGKVWARANGDVVAFFDSSGLVATLLLQADSWLAFTPAGWFSRSGEAGQHVRIFRPDGKALDAREVATRHAPDKVLAALTDG